MAHEILIVDDESDIRMLIAGALDDEGFVTRDAADADGALAAVRARRPSLVLLDIWLEGSSMDGIELLEVIRGEQPDLPVVMISGHGTVEMAVNAIKKGAYDFIEKPFKIDRLLLVIERAIEAAQLRREIEELKFRAGGISDLAGSSPAINEVRQAVERVAPTSSRVLITGPAGAGKEVVARMVHQRSARASGPFVAVNCATMHPDRMEAELFGVEPQTDPAVPSGKVGVFERAHGGTLLLDEVADMPLETQGKIVRVLQDQRFDRVGGSTPVEVDVRVIASSAKDLISQMEEGRFREDLYYRLKVVPIEVPPLRTRLSDIPSLAESLMESSAQRAGLPKRAFAEDALAALQAYHWPGNVRQLANVVDWLLIMAPEGAKQSINARMLPPEITDRSPGASRLEGTSEIMALPLREARETFEREYLMAQVNRFGGNISRTATFVGMERSALHRKLKSLGIAGADKAEPAPRKYDA